MRTIRRVIVSALIFSKDGKLLMGRKNSKGGGVYADCWHIPGGGLEDGETQSQALLREVFEETGIDIRSYKRVLVDDQGKGQAEKILRKTGEKVLCDMQFNVYRVDISACAADVVLNPADDLQKLAWVDVEQLRNYKLTPPSESLFTRLHLL